MKICFILENHKMYGCLLIRPEGQNVSQITWAKQGDFRSPTSFMIMETSGPSEICSQEEKTIERQVSTDCSTDNVALKKFNNSKERPNDGERSSISKSFIKKRLVLVR